MSITKRRSSESVILRSIKYGVELSVSKRVK